ncbi:MAG: DNA integrity scanning protein DisA nucleotide-binding domain protein [Syntrophales bacterium]
MTAMLSRLIVDFAYRIGDEIGAKAVMYWIDVDQNPGIVNEGKSSAQTILVTRGDKEIPEDLVKSSSILKIPNLKLTRVGQIKIAITKGIAMGLLKKGDKVVCLTGIPKFGYVDSIMIIDVGREFEILTSEYITSIFEGLQPEVFEAVLNIALELGSQGREGRSVGTIFILGDHERVLQYSRQIIINPFAGYQEEEKNILNPALKDTIKEFSALDGAFIIKSNGVLMTAGSHISAALESKDFPKGLGSRHLAAAGITAVTDAVAVVVSESTGTVRVFKKGRIIVSIEKPVE